MINLLKKIFNLLKILIVGKEKNSKTIQKDIEKSVVEIQEELKVLEKKKKEIDKKSDSNKEIEEYFNE